MSEPPPSKKKKPVAPVFKPNIPVKKNNDDIVYESKSLGMLKDVKQEKDKKPAQQSKHTPKPRALPQFAPVGAQVPLNPVIAEQERIAREKREKQDAEERAAKALARGGGGGGAGGSVRTTDDAGESSTAAAVKKEPVFSLTSTNHAGEFDDDERTNLSELFKRSDPTQAFSLPLADDTDRLAPILTDGQFLLIQMPSHLPIMTTAQRESEQKQQQHQAAVLAQQQQQQLLNQQQQQQQTRQTSVKSEPNVEDINDLVRGLSLNLRAPPQALTLEKFSESELDQPTTAELTRPPLEKEEGVLLSNKFDNPLTNEQLDGRVGKLTRYKSGRVSMEINGFTFWVNRGVFPTHYTTVVNVSSVNEDSDDLQLRQGPRLDDVLVVTPSTAHLLSALKSEQAALATNRKQ